MGAWRAAGDRGERDLGSTSPALPIAKGASHFVSERLGGEQGVRRTAWSFSLHRRHPLCGLHVEGKHFPSLVAVAGLFHLPENPGVI